MLLQKLYEPIFLRPACYLDLNLRKIKRWSDACWSRPRLLQLFTKNIFSFSFYHVYRQSTQINHHNFVEILVRNMYLWICKGYMICWDSDQNLLGICWESAEIWLKNWWERLIDWWGNLPRKKNRTN